MADTTDALATALREVRERLGERAFDDRRQVISLLSDKLPDARREIRAVGSAIDEGVPGALTGTQRQHLGWEMDRQADKLENNTGLNVELARRAVRALAYSLDLGPLPSAYPAGPITSPPTVVSPPPPDSRWLGDSVTPVAPSPPPPPPSFPPRPFPPQGYSQPVQPSYVAQPRWTPAYGGPPIAPPRRSKLLLVLGIAGGSIVGLFILLVIIGLAIGAGEKKCDDSEVREMVLQLFNTQYTERHESYTATALSAIESLGKTGETTRCSATMALSNNVSFPVKYSVTGNRVVIEATNGGTVPANGGTPAGADGTQTGGDATQTGADGTQTGEIEKNAM